MNDKINKIKSFPLLSSMNEISDTSHRDITHPSSFYCERTYIKKLFLFEKIEHLPHFLLQWLGAVNPVDWDTLPFHAAKPGHLTLGEATDVGEEAFEHLLFCYPALQEERHMAVFEAVAQQSLGRYALPKESIHLFDHAAVDTLS